MKILSGKASEEQAGNPSEKASEKQGEEAVQTLILTADTVVIAPTADEQNDQEGKGVILGKPKDEEDAVRMLRMLSGKTHHVVTGVCLTTRSQQRHFSVITEVTFKHLQRCRNQLLHLALQAIRQGRSLRHSGMDRLCRMHRIEGQLFQCHGASRTAHL